MIKEHQLTQQLLSAQQDTSVADSLIEQYLPFIKSETAKFLNRPLLEGRDDDELSISMFAFYESIMAYRKHKGSFLGLASLTIKNRLIDHYRKEKRHSDQISLDAPVDETFSEPDILVNSIASPHNKIDESMNQSIAYQELTKYADELKEFDLSLSHIADNCPRQNRTYQACMKALEYAKEHPDLLDTLTRTKKLPIAQLSSGSGIEKKTLERHRKYLIAIMFAYTNGFEIIRGHIHQIKRKDTN